jgi:DNA modification methylase
MSGCALIFNIILNNFQVFAFLRIFNRLTYMKKLKFEIYNSSSEDMRAVPDNCVDIVIFAPPYNINTPYDEDNSDSKNFIIFKKLLESVIKESFRVLKPGGVFLNESADSVYSQNKLIALSDLIQKICLDSGFNIQHRHINFLQSKSGVVLKDLEHNWSDDYFSNEESHSNCHQWTLFRKKKVKFNSNSGKIFYVNYPAMEEGHPCPFSFEHVKIFLKLAGFKKGMTVVEPFMGTARLGEEVVKRQGKYIGFELSKKHFETAKKRLESI